MRQRRAKGRRLLVVAAMLVAVAAVYIALSIGIVDDIAARISRSDALDRVDMAVEADPPNVGHLLQAIRGRDWYVAAGAAEGVSELRREGRLGGSEADLAIATLMEVLGSRGHWWRFGWDEEEAEFDQFRTAAIEAVASFGSRALPSVDRALGSKSSYAREAACWVVVAMLSQGSLDREVLTAWPLWSRIDKLAVDDPEYGVRYACQCAHEAAGGG